MNRIWMKWKKETLSKLSFYTPNLFTTCVGSATYIRKACPTEHYSKCRDLLSVSESFVAINWPSLYGRYKLVFLTFHRLSLGRMATICRSKLVGKFSIIWLSCSLTIKIHPRYIIWMICRFCAQTTKCSSKLCFLDCWNYFLRKHDLHSRDERMTVCKLS